MFVSVGNAASPANVSDPATASLPAVRVQFENRALLVSDSAWLNIKLRGAVDSVQGFRHSLALASCRRRISTSCTNFNGFVPITLEAELVNHEDRFQTLIVATGYNDSDHNFASDVDRIVTLARSLDYERIVWLTLRSNVAYLSPDDLGFAEVFENNNAAIADLVASGDYPEIVIADWATYARNMPDWFAADGIHLRGAGAFAAGDYISRKMAFLDGRACPQPTVAGAEPLNPCPDPDGHGPTIDLDSLYPIGEPIPSEPFVLGWEGSSSWPSPPWWELPT